jgi:hypothetical protein
VLSLVVHLLNFVVTAGIVPTLVTTTVSLTVTMTSSGCNRSTCAQELSASQLSTLLRREILNRYKVTLA